MFHLKYLITTGLLIALASCSKSDSKKSEKFTDPKKENLLGTWIATSVTDEDGKTTELEEENSYLLSFTDKYIQIYQLDGSELARRGFAQYYLFFPRIGDMDASLSVLTGTEKNSAGYRAKVRELSSTRMLLSHFEIDSTEVHASMLLKKISWSDAQDITSRLRERLKSIGETIDMPSTSPSASSSSSDSASVDSESISTVPDFVQPKSRYNAKDMAGMWILGGIKQTKGGKEKTYSIEEAVAAGIYPKSASWVVFEIREDGTGAYYIDRRSNFDSHLDAPSADPFYLDMSFDKDYDYLRFGGHNSGYIRSFSKIGDAGFLEVDHLNLYPIGENVVERYFSMPDLPLNEALWNNQGFQFAHPKKFEKTKDVEGYWLSTSYVQNGKTFKYDDVNDDKYSYTNVKSVLLHVKDGRLQTFDQDGREWYSTSRDGSELHQYADFVWESNAMVVDINRRKVRISVSLPKTDILHTTPFYLNSSSSISYMEFKRVSFEEAKKALKNSEHIQP